VDSRKVPLRPGPGRRWSNTMMRNARALLGTLLLMPVIVSLASTTAGARGNLGKLAKPGPHVLAVSCQLISSPAIASFNVDNPAGSSQPNCFDVAIFQTFTDASGHSTVVNVTDQPGVQITASGVVTDLGLVGQNERFCTDGMTTGAFMLTGTIG